MAAAGPPPPPPPPPKVPFADVVFLRDSEIIQRLESYRRTVETTSGKLPDNGAKLRASIVALEREFIRRGLQELQINNRTEYWEVLTEYDSRLGVLRLPSVNAGLPDIGDTEWDLLQEEWSQIGRDEIGVGYRRDKLVGRTLDLFKKHAKVVRPEEVVINDRTAYMREMIGYDLRLNELSVCTVNKGLPFIGDTEWDLLQEEWSQLRRHETAVGYRRHKLVDCTLNLLKKYAKDEKTSVGTG